MLLAGDIGGTNTRLAIFSKDSDPKSPLFQETFLSKNYTGLEEIVKKFLSKCNINSRCKLQIDSACIGVAGHVSNGHAAITNLPWIIQEKTLSLELGITTVRLLNDLEAIACAIPFLEDTDFDSINQGKSIPNGTIALIAPGTGLGEAFLTWDGNRYHAHASEGGHASFAPTSQLESDLLQYMRNKYKHVSYERVCSGTGIPNLYFFLRDTNRFEEPQWLMEKLKNSTDPSPVIFNTATDPNHNSAICIAVLDMFISILGNEAANLALKVLSDGGVYLAGGIPPRIREKLKQGIFMEAFNNKGRFSTILSLMPVHIIMHPNAALVGAACRGFGL
ncbi:MAG: glucokinase [Desulfamplus sp.]|nr:glucokinase [Desulfamplus sp.]